MNERIKELADQCHHRYSEHHIDLEKFAELIVRECVFISRTSANGFSAGDRMKEHFGVEQ